MARIPSHLTNPKLEKLLYSGKDSRLFQHMLVSKIFCNTHFRALQSFYAYPYAFTFHPWQLLPTTFISQIKTRTIDPVVSIHVI
jgi:hypothetical protein